jgi:probable addiction module antidote protein
MIYDDLLKEKLQDKEFVICYLNASIAQCFTEQTLFFDNSAFLYALKNVVTATIGFTELAKRSGLQREHLYRSLSHKGNPEFFYIVKVLKALDINIKFEAINEQQ